jgi:NAD(P)-dependent dehydrogenase (short-subunit alcohol dehydrogenase family)
VTSGTALPATPSFRLDHRRALVTGAGRGIGQAIATALASVGSEVVLVARTSEEIETTARRLSESGLVARSRVLDVTDLSASAKLIADEAPFDILINNAGANRPKPVTDVTASDYDTVTNLNVRAPFFLSQAFAARLIGAGLPGVIINVSSQMGHVGARDRVLYCTTKFALEGMTKSMAVELAEYGIRVNSVCPTFIETPMTKPMFAVPGFRQEVLGKIPMGRLGSVEDVMGAVVYLASDAAALVTGASLLVDGGWTAV